MTGREPWQIEQGARCGCRGSDDMCCCQNVNPWPAPVIDWQTRAIQAEAALAAIRIECEQKGFGFWRYKIYALAGEKVR